MADVEYFSGSKKFQFMAAGSANLGAFGLGTVLAWTSPALPSLKLDKNFLYLNTDSGRESLLGSIVPIGAICACLVTGFLIGKLGRKTTMLLTAPLFLLGWLLISFALNYEMLVIGRYITGFTGGAFSLAAPVYVGETAESKLRGMLGSGFQLMVVLGIFFVYVLGYFVAWNWLSIACAFVPVIFAVCMFFMPESPRYYIFKGKTLDAASSLMKLRGAHNESVVAPELSAIKQGVEEAVRNQATFKDLLHPTILKPTSMMLALMFCQQLSGINAVIFYTTDIFTAAGSDIEPGIATIMIGAVQIVATLGSMALVDRAGRKMLLAISDVLMGLSLVALGAFFYLDESKDPVVDDLGWLPLVSMIMFIVAFSLGYGPIPWMMVGEILPPRALGLASSVATVFNWFLAFLVTMFFKPTKDAIGGSWCFWIFAIVCGIGTLFVVTILPETKGKSLDEIQALFGSPERNRSRSYQGTSNQAFQNDDK